MGFLLLSLVLSSFLITAASILNSPPPLPCNYTAIYNFGDSNSDTGGIAAAFYPPLLPFGETFFHRPAGRASDGRLIIDFIAEKLGLPYLSPYLDSIASNFRRGANFATGGATIQRPNSSWFVDGLSPFNLEIQVEHFNQLKGRSAYYYNQSGKDNDEIVKRLSNPEDLGRALFILDIGQNDIAAAAATLTRPAAVAGIVDQFIHQIGILYGLGATTFWIHSTGPFGCLPAVISKSKNADDEDEYGCVRSLNRIAMEFNRELKSRIGELRTRLPRAAVVYVDMYAAKYGLISDAAAQGFEDGRVICCGYHGMSYDIWCGKNGALENGTNVYADSCKNPRRVISWDGVHYTEAANRWFADRIADGSLSDPPVALATACHMHATPITN
ncbi:GDSL esterase/lipase At5g14450-like [Andrographis paniculata]|uniref:GDSL esterase/lipase At5g14450-like n=1 Tax=Andrographis paniculata TaxID=175694 RepID=UPI0021E76788|nr:GDSL esterase/lipase At5g14450-like [Andrographis paniculata]